MCIRDSLLLLHPLFFLFFFLYTLEILTFITNYITQYYRPVAFMVQFQFVFCPLDFISPALVCLTVVVVSGLVVSVSLVRIDLSVFVYVYIVDSISKLENYLFKTSLLMYSNTVLAFTILLKASLLFAY